ncbi:uncharacterized protein BCR38DRAFT_436577 [Pseudomassariella vexata]|uniref:Small secreted protein n=1 Tax=Pseudomassariella vexata TaxID=1141098 RepID=A0A1Y2DVQ9_9PEZI|nr:uncharacterized protein BCR38DRAFT_436577 [Pseudomassariella vexata]ORY63338.1 hypothetical protein BCR38DRAFT_436577 [Pseudomassariella vexata]
MKFSLVLATFAAVATAAPLIRNTQLSRRAPVFTAKTYNELSISDGTAGNGKAEALEKLSGLPTNLATVDEADITFLNAVNQISNDAERGAYNVKIAAATPGEEVLALQRGKIKNKIFKLTATVLQLEAQQAQGENVTAKLTEETTKLNKNIADDEANAGKASTGLPFDATTANPEASNVAKDEMLAAKAGDVVKASEKLAAAAAAGNAAARN